MCVRVCVMRARVSVCKNTEEEEEEEEDNKKTRENDILKAKYRCLSIFILFISKLERHTNLSLFLSVLASTSKNYVKPKNLL